MEHTCINPEAIEAWQYEAFADGEPIQSVAEHIQQCPACKQKVEEIIAENRAISNLFAADRAHCPSPQTLQAYYFGELEDDIQRNVQHHLKKCIHCAEEMVFFKHFMLSSASDTDSLTKSIRRKIAAINTDIRLKIARFLQPPAQPAFALRGTTVKTLLYEVEDVAISLEFEKKYKEMLSITGQILGVNTDTSGGTIRFFRKHAEDFSITQPLQANGTFVIENCPYDAYQIIISLPNQTIMIPQITLNDDLFAV